MKKIIIGLAALLTLWACQEEFTLPTPQNNTSPYSEGGLVETSNPNSSSTTLWENKDLTFHLTASSIVAENTPVELESSTALEKIVQDFNKFKGVKDYTLLPEQYFQFQATEIPQGGKTSEITLTFNDYDNIPMGDYLLPVSIKVGKEKLQHMVILHKDDNTFVPLSDTQKKPMPPVAYSCPDRTEPMKMVAYVETNDWDIRNMGQFLLSESNQPIFDIVILFAANMNYDGKTGKRVLHFNDKLQPILKDPEKYIKPLTDRGIKVLIDILPNHQGVGYENFQSYEEALEFAQQCKYYTDLLGIDGWDIDEEYADYGALPSKPKTQPRTKSYLWFMRAMKETMPDKLLTLYDYGHPFNRRNKDTTDETGKKAADYLDYSWANYGWASNNAQIHANNKYGIYSIEASRGQLSRSTQRAAQQNLQKCYGLLMIFNIQGGDIKGGYAAEKLSEATQLFYGQSCKFVGNYHKGPRDR